MPYDTEMVRRELNTLQFAKVTKIVVDNGNLINSGSSDEERMYSHFCGFAVSGGTTVWFKKASYRPLFIGGVTHRPPLNTFSEYPKKGELIVGKIRDTAKGPVFDFWCHHAEPIYEFASAIEKGPKALSSSTRSYGKLKTSFTRTKSEDDLYVMARLLLLKDVDSIVREYGPEEHRMRHPQRQARGIQIERGLVEFVYLTSLFSRDPRILKDFYDRCGGALPANAEMYSIDSLRTLLET